MAPFWTLLGTLIGLMASSSAAPSSFPPVTIPTAPEYSPSPAISPDINPLLPSPKGGGATPATETSLPIIPSSPSPPNPDGEASGGPVSTPLASSAAKPEVSTSSSVRMEGLNVLSLVLFFSLATYNSLQLVGILLPPFTFF
ncbi:hypothetical protein SAY87_023537 [Trapa incisa]|uniref:Uncharacterized protein n=1 Tax=Trapa incisa TaxID=236973 RepID=A0AAN7QS88_9MYRT|nr:hypothetical protein SAY87_023537 [Trapa incisa]